MHEDTNTINVWHVETRRKLASLEDSKVPFWSPDGRHLVTFATYERVSGMSYASDGRMAAVSPDAHFVAMLWERCGQDDRGASGSWKQLEIWNLATATRARLLWREQTFLNPVDNALGTKSYSYWIIRLWEIPTGKPLAQWQAHDASVLSLAWMPDSKRLISGAADGVLKVWNIAAIRDGLSDMMLDWNDDRTPPLRRDAL